MNILVTGAKGMVGTALVANLKNIKENKNRTRPNIQINEIYEYDLDSTPEQLDAYCRSADFVFNLAGVNRPETLYPAVSATRSTGALRKPERSCSSPMPRKPEQRSRFTASRT